mmetsp:Transcript_106384/g.296005  ORF Transcript_106384/g.296005 Transcript_106384/m.296005 type:complete len:470 (+) Transcript_106384:799-2208(+)
MLLLGCLLLLVPLFTLFIAQLLPHFAELLLHRAKTLEVRVVPHHVGPLCADEELEGRLWSLWLVLEELQLCNGEALLLYPGRNSVIVLFALGGLVEVGCLFVVLVQLLLGYPLLLSFLLVGKLVELLNQISCRLASARHVLQITLDGVQWLLRKPFRLLRLGNVCWTFCLGLWLLDLHLHRLLELKPALTPLEFSHGLLVLLLFGLFILHQGLFLGKVQGIPFVHEELFEGVSLGLRVLDSQRLGVLLRKVLQGADWLLGHVCEVEILGLGNPVPPGHQLHLFEIRLALLAGGEILVFLAVSLHLLFGLLGVLLLALRVELLPHLGDLRLVRDLAEFVSDEEPHGVWRLGGQALGLLGERQDCHAVFELPEDLFLLLKEALHRHLQSLALRKVLLPRLLCHEFLAVFLPLGKPLLALDVASVFGLEVGLGPLLLVLYHLLHALLSALGCGRALGLRCGLALVGHEDREG